MTPFLGISVTIIIRFKSLNIANLVLKLANIWHFDQNFLNLVTPDDLEKPLMTFDPNIP